MPYALLARVLRAGTTSALPLDAQARTELARVLPELGVAPAGALNEVRFRQAVMQAVAAWRAAGIGCALSAQLEHIARTAGDTEIVVSATPSGNTVGFYLGRGFVPAKEPLQELFELEPDDVHMRKAL